VEVLGDGVLAVRLRDGDDAEPWALEQADLAVDDDVVAELGAPAGEQRGQPGVALTRPERDQQARRRP
jgi:hypothetical protein